MCYDFCALSHLILNPLKIFLAQSNTWHREYYYFNKSNSSNDNNTVKETES